MNQTTPSPTTTVITSDDLGVELPRFVIAIDDREKIVLPFPQEVETRRCHLPFGDYSVVGLEHRVAIERKSISDLVQTLWSKSQLADGSYQQNSKRFAYELQRMRDEDLDDLSLFVRRYVVIEGTERDLEHHFTFRSHKVEHFGHKQRADFPKTMSFISSLEMRYGTMFMFAQSREAAAAKVYSSLYHFWRFANGMSRDPVGDYTPPNAESGSH